jgi:hypothetical protein
MPLDDIQQKYDELQRRLVPLWEIIGRSELAGADEDENTIVVIPSLTVDLALTGSMQQAYEERFLFLLLLLRQPRVRMVYVTSGEIAPNIVDYYLHLLPGVTVSNARKRLFLISPLDASPRPLSSKLLDRPRLLEEIRSLAVDVERAHIVPFNTTDLERQLAVRLGIPMYAADPHFFALGTKSGSRRIFAEEGVPHPSGFEDLTTEADVVNAIVQMRSVKPGMQAVIVKLNEGVSGLGNAVVGLQSLPDPGDRNEYAAVERNLRDMQFEMPGATYAAYLEKLRQGGAIVEELLIGDEMRSPSAQIRITPLGEVELLSTHDQVLGGPSGQSYLGARFPADTAYGPMIMREAAKVARRFAREGVIGRFALDFVVVRSQNAAWQPFAIEVNLRKGGTTHPFLTLQYLTDGHFDPASGEFITSRGDRKCYRASDHVESPRYTVFTPDTLFDIVSRDHLHFDHARQTGVILHMMSCVGDLGRFGMTVIADDHRGAENMYQRAVQIFDTEAESALEGDGSYEQPGGAASR